MGDEDSTINFYYSALRKNVKTFGQVNWVLKRWGRKIKSYMPSRALSAAKACAPKE